jgi:hypothetical protein
MSQSGNSNHPKSIEKITLDDLKKRVNQLGDLKSRKANQLDTPTPYPELYSDEVAYAITVAEEKQTDHDRYVAFVNTIEVSFPDITDGKVQTTSSFYTVIDGVDGGVFGTEGSSQYLWTKTIQLADVGRTYTACSAVILKN